MKKYTQEIILYCVFIVIISIICIILIPYFISQVTLTNEEKEQIINYRIQSIKKCNDSGLEPYYSRGVYWCRPIN